MGWVESEACSGWSKACEIIPQTFSLARPVARSSLGANIHVSEISRLHTCSSTVHTSIHVAVLYIQAYM